MFGIWIQLNKVISMKYSGINLVWFFLHLHAMHLDKVLPIEFSFSFICQLFKLFILPVLFFNIHKLLLNLDESE